MDLVNLENLDFLGILFHLWFRYSQELLWVLRGHPVRGDLGFLVFLGNLVIQEVLLFL